MADIKTWNSVQADLLKHTGKRPIILKARNVGASAIKAWNSDAKGKFLRNVERVVQIIYDLQEKGIPAKLELEVAGYEIKNLKVERRYSREADEKLLRENLRGSLTVLFQDSKISGYLQRETFAPID